MVKLHNPLAFTPGPVTVFTTLIYTALLAALIVVHTHVPSAPNSSTPVNGIDLTEAWRDLQSLTTFYHPYNSHNNDEVREFLLSRIDQILETNGANIEYPNGPELKRRNLQSAATDTQEVYVFDDVVSNVTSSAASQFGAGEGISVYFESTNIVVYIRGSEDDERNWWEEYKGSPTGKGGVLVNAHYDSVSTGFGATDDGVGVITVLQLIKYYSTPGQQPRHGLVALLNNGEEDFLNGARAFGVHPLSKFPHTFLNLEGAGAGGRAHMFRATDAEVARAYEKSPKPFSSVISSDGFKMGAIKSQTDYVIFNGELGMRGLDVAFMEPRARYHTDEDDSRHTSKDSLWHMLAAAIATTKYLTSDTSDKFDGNPYSKGKIDSGKGSMGVWFDLFGHAFAVFHLHTFFALSVTLLVVAPVLLMVTSAILYKFDKFYLFSGSRLYHGIDGDDEIKLYGWRGFFRWPVIFVASCAVPVALAFLITKQNPFIIHSSQWSVWAMMFSSWIFVAWFLCCAAYFTRPSALTRVYGYIWLLMFFWAVLVVDTVLETQWKLGSGYFLIFYFAALFLVTWLSHLELFSLPRKSKYCRSKIGGYDSAAASQILGGDNGERASSPGREGADEEDADESTSLLRGEGRRTTFANYTRNEDEAESPDPAAEIPEKSDTVSVDEQEWSSSLPRWTWLLQLIILAPIAIIFSMQSGFLLVSATHQTGPDGSSILLAYMMPAVFTILTLIPLLPVLHRVTWPVPHFILLVLIGTLVYNLIAFPFSTNNRLKLSFQQVVDIDSGLNNATLQGPQPYLHRAISNLPSATGKEISCAAVPGRESLQRCSWSGIPPNVVPSSMMTTSGVVSERSYQSWLNYNATSPSPVSPSNPNSARFFVGGNNTRACKLLFDKPISKFNVHGSNPDKRFPFVPEGGSKEIRLWSRSWDRIWGVDVEWENEEGSTSTERSSSDDEIRNREARMQGKVVCLWSDDNQVGLIPALDEVRHFAPDWTAVTKVADGLVEASKSFSL